MSMPTMLHYLHEYLSSKLIEKDLRSFSFIIIDIFNIISRDFWADGSLTDDNFLIIQ